MAGKVKLKGKSLKIRHKGWEMGKKPLPGAEMKLFYTNPPMAVSMC